MEYERIGFKCGIEIHQRLRTNKLFCSCSGLNVEESHKHTIERQIRAVSGELGLVDPAALYELLRGRRFVYRVYDKESDLVEMDEEPPHNMDANALYAALQMAKILGCEVPEEIHMMRKTVVDGSNTSGFQRTAIVGLNGSLDTTLGLVGISSVAVEEEASQILDREDSKVVYGLNRLGIPLIEIGTAPDIRSPSHAREVAERLGSLLRSTGLVQRGIGTIRQDVNVSVGGGARVEVKGFQELRMLEELIDKEVERQLSLLKIREDLLKREAFVDGKIMDATHVFANVKNKIIRSVIDSGGLVLAFKLNGFAGLLKEKISGDKTFGRELSDYAKAHGAKGMMHTDEDLGKYEIIKEMMELKTQLSVQPHDAIVIIAEKKGVVEKACLAVMERARVATQRIPEETRAANLDGTTSYLRPLPGGARMYPETDLPPIPVDRELIEAIPIPEPFDVKQRRFISLGLPEGLAYEIVRSEYLPLFEEAVAAGVQPTRAADLLVSMLKEMKRDGIPVDRISDVALGSVVKKMNEIPRDAMRDVIVFVANGKSAEEAIASVKTVNLTQLNEIIARVVRNSTQLIEYEGERAFPKLMGTVMAEVRGKADGALVAKRLREEIAKLK